MSPAQADDPDAPLLEARLPRRQHHHRQPGKLTAWWSANKGWVMVLISEFFGACMSAAVQVLADRKSEEAMHPMQIVWVRMTISCVLSSLYMWTKGTPDFPFGAKGLRPLLVMRGFAGFVGISTFWYSLLYLDLAEATVISFITPLLVTVVSAKLFHTPLPWNVIIAGLVSLAGVLVIAKPGSLLRRREGDGDGNGNGNGETSTLALVRIMAVCAGLVSVLAGTTAYTTIKYIGHGAHALISVNYYAFTSSIGAAVFLLAVPGIGFRLPSGPAQWALLTWVGVSGFLLQFLLTLGLQHDGSSVAVSMMYSQVLFALVLDELIWGNMPDGTSLVGGALVLVSTVYVSMQGGGDGVRDEEEGLLPGGDGAEEGGGGGQERGETPLPENLVNE